MKIVRGRAADAATSLRSDTFTGTVWADPVLPATDGTTINVVTFAPGARTHWHHHTGGQILQVLAGQGWVCAEGGPAQRLLPGDTVWVPPGERHWHGASETTLMTHTAISIGPTQWHDEVAAGDYARAHHDEESG
ncbi:cupin domain-containing protein [Nonomuraea sp. NPDC048882]|uniref:cupin domain-containing protein n=1 Tax=Nonomuraea sp. NPDC048882 TaxID=3154347 RepID=UPI0033F9799E